MSLCNLCRIHFRLMFGPKHCYHKEYNEALDILNIRGHWFYLYDSLDGPNGEQVREALKAWIQAYQAKKASDQLCDETRLKRELHRLIYGDEFIEGEDGYVSDSDEE